MKIQRGLIFLVLLILLSQSCRTNHYLVKSSNYEEIVIDQIVIVSNNVSKIIPVAIYPKYQNVDGYVIGQRQNDHKIDSLILNEIVKNGLICEISENQIGYQDSYYIKYQDYWSWDLKKYMPILKIDLYNPNNNLLFTVISEGNTAGLHNFPNPSNQIPELIELIINQIK